jgi:translation initiation factor 2 subunit 2
MDKEKYLKYLDNAYDELPEFSKISKRFEIPKVSGIITRAKTTIRNFREIAKNFRRDENHLLKFFLKEVGVRGEILKNGYLDLHSKFNPSFLNKTVEKYFNSFVKCPNCESPDTELVENNTKIRCTACGHIETLSSK